MGLKTCISVIGSKPYFLGNRVLTKAGISSKIASGSSRSIKKKSLLGLLLIVGKMPVLIACALMMI